MVASDECYISLGWEVSPVSVLHPDVCGSSRDGVLAVHSLSKRSNLAGYRAGFVTGDPALVADLLAISKQAGMIMPDPVQAAMTAALDDDAHAWQQRQRYVGRRALLRTAFAEAGWTIDHSEAGLYLWATHPAHDCWSAAEWLAAEAGILVAPGELYGPARESARPGGADRHRRADRRRRGAAGRAASLSAAEQRTRSLSRSSGEVPGPEQRRSEGRPRCPGLNLCPVLTGSVRFPTLTRASVVRSSQTGRRIRPSRHKPTAMTRGESTCGMRLGAPRSGRRVSCRCGRGSQWPGSRSWARPSRASPCRARRRGHQGQRDPPTSPPTPTPGTTGTGPTTTSPGSATVTSSALDSTLTDCGAAAKTCFIYTGTIGDIGTFLAISGAKSPQAGVTITGTPSGPLMGGSDVTFFSSSDAASAAGVPASVTGAGVSTTDWVEQFFPSGTTFGPVPPSVTGAGLTAVRRPARTGLTPSATAVGRYPPTATSPA